MFHADRKKSRANYFFMDRLMRLPPSPRPEREINQIASAIRAGLLAVALQEFEPAPWPVSLVYAGQGLLPLKLRAFLDFAAPRLKARISA